jgi:UDP-N-acetylmuramate dehydrogenase
MIVEQHVPLGPHNSFGIVAKARALVRVHSAADVQAVLAAPSLAGQPHFVLGGGSNIVLTGDVKPLVLKVEIPGIRVVEDGPRATIVEAGAGVDWHALVTWTLDQGLPGLENLALIPGTVGAAPVQNIGAYGVELQDRFESLDAIHLATGQGLTLDATQCAFGYRDSVFKHVPPGAAGAVIAPPDLAAGLHAVQGMPIAVEPARAAGLGLAGQALILRVRFRLPKPWRPELSYLDLQRKLAETGLTTPTARQIYDWVCAIRRAKLPDPQVLGNAGSFFKNPTVTADQCADIIAREPGIVHYPLPDGTVKLAAGWLIDACGWKGKSVGQAGVYEKQALVLVNRGGATGGEVVTLAKAIQTSVYERFGIRLEPEPVVV